MTDGINWAELTQIFNGFIEEDGHLEVRVYHPAFDQGVEVVVPPNMREEFMKRLPLFEAEVSNGRNTRPGGF